MNDDFENANRAIRGQYDEWLGTATADDWTPNNDVYAEVGLDRDEWHIVGWEIHPLSDAYVTVLATKRADFDIPADAADRHAAWLQKIDEHGRLPVHRIHVDVPLERVFKRFGIKLFAKSIAVGGIPVEIVGVHEVDDY